jgi:hypothetical protein
MKREKTKLDYHRLTIDLEIEMYKALKSIAAAEERSVSKQAKMILKEWLEDHDK